MSFNIAQSGIGDQVVLIHGLGSNLQSWDVVAEKLERRFNVLRYDLRGHGKSFNPAGPWELGDFIEDLETIVHQEKFGKTHLVGFSLGGLIAQGYTLKHPEVVNNLVIISAVADRTESERTKVNERVANLESGHLDTNIALAMERWFSPEFRQQYPEKVQDRLNVLKTNDPQGYLNAYRVFGLGDLGEKLHNIQSPTLIMTGEYDPGSNVRMSKFMHNKIKGSKLKILPNLRHSVLVEAPDLIAHEVDSFLSDSP